jgi:predicted metal-dependent hydrolase
VADLRIRKIQFDLSEDVPFDWNPSDPSFSVQMDAVSVIAVGFETFIIAAMREAHELFASDAARAEGDDFTTQEALHAGAHRQHLRSLIRQYPGLRETLEQVLASFDHLTKTKSLKFRMAYIADLEASFTPYFKLLLDNVDELFGPGDDRVASLFLWHFVEEVEHRSSALIAYQALYKSDSYRTMVLPAVLKHLRGVMKIIAAGFNEHVPHDVRKIDARILDPGFMLRTSFRQKIARGKEPIEPFPHSALDDIPKDETKASVRGILRSQLPGHDPEHQPLPAFAADWIGRFDQGYDVAHWHTAAEMA